MIRSYSLQDYEIQQSQALDTERTQLFAQIGALTLDLEAAKNRRGDLDTRARALIGIVAQRLKLVNYRSIRIENNQLIADLPDEESGPALVRPAREGN